MSAAREVTKYPGIYKWGGRYSYLYRDEKGKRRLGLGSDAGRGADGEGGGDDWAVAGDGSCPSLKRSYFLKELLTSRGYRPARDSGSRIARRPDRSRPHSRRG
jgi:hypothetical protein